ncbi:MAG: hypothetical protein HZA46_01825 [Planctomycetales bacterium]|nr:hypothetical protein [Planctomycetales bacterium]
MSRPSSKLVLAMLLVCGTAFATDEDPIKKKLDAAKLAYELEMKSFETSVEEWLDKREELARKDGNKKQVDLVKAERTVFQEEGVLPKDLPISVRRKATLARSTIEAAFAVAVKEYTKAKLDDEASDVERELADFKANRTTASSIGSARTNARDSEASTLAANNVINPKEWVLPRKGEIVVSKNGHVQLRQADSELVTRKADYKEVEIRVTLSASKGTLAYLAVGLSGKRPITSAIIDDGKAIQVGNQSSNFKSPELGLGPKPITYDEMFEILLRTSGGVGRVYVADKLTSGVTYDKNGKPEMGSVGLVLKKGSLTIKSVEIKEIR